MNAHARSDARTRETAVETLRAFIAAGGYRPGDRLPSERALIDSLGLSRTTLRKALDELERGGAIWRHVGKGTFIASTAEGARWDALADLGREVTPVKMMRARLCIEPAIAREAAINASAAAVTRLRLAEDRAARAASWEEYETQDDLFHRSVAEAADNPLLVAIFDRLYETRRSVAGVKVPRGSARPEPDHPSFAEHRDLVAAIEARDPARAQDAMRVHVGGVCARLFGEV